MPRLSMIRKLSFASLLAMSWQSYATNTLSIELQKSAQGDWSVEYKTSQPVKRIVFNNSPNKSRAERWSSDSGDFEIDYNASQESIRHKNGKQFSQEKFELTPTCTHLPKSYAPFSPFADGGMIINSGRFFACIETCNAQINNWKMSLTVPSDEHIVLDGEVLNESARWIDGNDGKAIYIGKQQPLETAGTLSLIDQGLPKKIRMSLDTDIPKLMLHFEQKLGSLSNSNKPTLFASYSKRPGKDTQGGTLPGQIFIRWDSDDLEEQVDSQKFLQQTLLYFAHEVAHFFQASWSFASSSEAWIHEGNAELFAINALRELYPSSNAFVDLRQIKAGDSCIEGLTTISLANASKNGKFSMHYDCGVVIHQRIEDELSNLQSPQTLYAVRQQYRRRVLSGAAAGQATFLEVVENYTSSDVCDQITIFIETRHSYAEKSVATLSKRRPHPKNRR